MTIRVGDYAGPDGVEFIRGTNNGDILVWNTATNRFETEPGSAAAGASISSLGLAENTLVPNNLDGIEWSLSAQQLAPTIQPLASADPAGYRDMVWVNRELIAPAGAYLQRPFTPPAGVTQVTFSALVALPPGSAGNPIQLQLLDATGQNVLTSLNVVPGALARKTTAVLPVVAGVEYIARITFVSAGQADALLGDLRVSPVQATATVKFWQKDFVRIPANPQTIRDSNEDSWAAVRYANQSAFSHVDFNCSAPEIFVETYDNAGLYIVNADAFAVVVNDKVWATAFPIIDQVSYTRFTLPDGVNRVSVLSGPQALPSNFDVTNRGTFICAIYAAKNTVFEAPIVNDAPQDKVVLYGDSKLAGFYSDLAGRDGIVPLLRAMGNTVINQAVGGGSLSADTSTTALTVAACLPFAAKLVRNKPTRIVLGIGRNDFFGNDYTLANWTTQLGNLCDAIGTLAPDTQINLLRFTHETAEPANGFGDTLDQWRDAMNTVAAARSNVSVLYGDGLWSVATAGTYTADGVHPNSRGYAMLASLIDTWVPAPGNPIFGVVTSQLGEPYPWNPRELGGAALRAWWSFDQSLVASVMTAVSSSGTAPPVVTLTGVPTFPFTIVLAVTVAGALGASRFKWSIDGGQSWVQTGVLTGANVPLGTTGLTAHFAVGAYSNDNVYAAATKTVTARDLSTHGNDLGQAVAANQFPVDTIIVPGRYPRRALKGNGTSTALSRVMTLNSPYAIWLVGTLVDQASIRSFIGGSAGADDVFLYSNTPATMALNAAGAQKQVNVDATVPHTYGCIVNAGTDITIRVDGVGASAASAGASNPTSFYIGGDVANNQWFVDGVIAECLILDGLPTANAIVEIEAYFRNKYRTW